MLDTNKFGELLKSYGFNTFVGVPCSFLSPLINYALNENKFIMANNEGDGVAIASGISLVGEETGVVLMQNSGLSNALSPLSSLNHTFELPILGFVSLRGEIGISDEPQHELLGIITDKILETFQIPYEYLSPDLSIAKEQITKAKEIISKNKSFFFIVRKNTFEEITLLPQTIQRKKEGILVERGSRNTPITRLQALNVINEINDKDSITLATTGKTGRELYEINDAKNYLYMVGSMGCVSSLGLGLSLMSDKKIICIDGDGALLMRMGGLSTNAYYAKGNFCHICLDNHSHDSTGGQFTLSINCDIPKIALDSGYKKVFKIHDLESFKNTLIEFIKHKENDGAIFIYLQIEKGSKKDLSRPKIKPFEVKERLQRFLRDN
ncbi:phosphonopyruvate decarboxylase [Helicobacter cappadocius]|uniref:Phosphonopyruvate decarboxylase n=1 Tax=Helicobacter cappadocius TaxID=3063998 RepID=A0AA90T5S5_9HELI|nr:MULTISPECIES: phosphonopyruvate decarboxylase [unclassified Helicobacter]MDO7253869.1 phosphonopyruvate decarboxylase [Helicobacter sp. faydin-H75]MDP2539813.1 phosphonopyruvate decarboxylase [Helicobacter sp. faydin-H76]